MSPKSDNIPILTNKQSEIITKSFPPFPPLPSFIKLSINPIIRYLHP